MIDPKKLIEFIKASKAPEDLKKRLFPIVQIADEDTRKKIFEKINKFNDDWQAIENGNYPITAEQATELKKEAQKILSKLRVKGEELCREDDAQKIAKLEEEMAEMPF